MNECKSRETRLKGSKFFASLLLVLISYIVNSQNKLEWNLKSRYDISQLGFINIIDDARNHFNSSPNDSIIIVIDAGTYNIGGNGNPGINLWGGLLKEDSQGRLIFQGAGIDQTILVFTEKGEDMVRGRNIYHLEFRDMTMTRTKHTVTQGTVVSVAAGEVVLDIEQGFPSPLELFAVEGGGGRFEAGRYLRKYTKSKTDPLVILENNEQVAWGWRDVAPKYPEQVSGNQWRIYLNRSTEVLNNYAPGDYVGVKSKSEGHIYWFTGGNDLVFRNIRWMHSSRGLVRGGFSNVGLYGCRIERGEPINGQTPCLATPSGGPQMNQDGDPVSVNMIVEDCYFDSTGDDNVAFFNVDGGSVKNTVIRNGFARGILATSKTKNICLDNVILDNAYLEDGPLSTDHSTTQKAISAGGAYNDDCIVGAALLHVTASGESLVIYPNPGDGYLTISISSVLIGAEVELFDLKGNSRAKLILASSPTQFDLSVLQPGVYIVKLSKGNMSVSHKIIIDKD